MQLSHTFFDLALVMLSLAGASIATPLVSRAGDEGVTTIAADEPGARSYVVSHEQMMHWIANTDANLTFVGKPINPLAPRSAQDTTVVYCTTRIGGVCGSPCTVYNGGTTCLDAPDTNCLSATNDIGFCDAPGCTGHCTALTNCILSMDYGFCWTPNTQSILVSTA